MKRTASRANFVVNVNTVPSSNEPGTVWKGGSSNDAIVFLAVISFLAVVWVVFIHRFYGLTYLLPSHPAGMMPEAPSLRGIAR